MLHALSWAHGEDAVQRIAEATAGILYAVGLRRGRHGRDRGSQPLIREGVYHGLRAANFHLDTDDGSVVAARDISKSLIRLGWRWRSEKESNQRDNG